jgi:hypothetical protein
MLLNHGAHLAYCTNVHPGEDWAQTFDSLNRHTLAVKAKLGLTKRYAIGLRLSDQASRELSDSGKLLEFQRWLDKHDCYVFTINGFPFGRFHGARVKERVYLPDWTDPQRLDYTKRLFDLLSQLVPAGIEGSVSTSPGSFKEFITTPEQEQRIRANLWACVEHVAQTCERAGRSLHLGVEPEPLGLFENSEETVRFFERVRHEHPNDERLEAHLGVNYDACHFAVEFEEPQTALARFREHRIRLSKIHVSNALKLTPTPTALAQLAAFQEDVYLHQVIARQPDGSLTRFRDIDLALASKQGRAPEPGTEWRIHFHIPLHTQPTGEFDTTSDQILGLLKLLQAQPKLCSHLEMETYTWSVLPETLKTCDVSDQLVAEYRWTLKHLADYGLTGTANMRS